MGNLLIGGTGFIGSALTAELLRANESVTVLSRDQGQASGVKYIQADLDRVDLDPKLLKGITTVFILIGQIGPGFDAAKELSTLKKLSTALRLGGQRVFYFSSALVYGQCKQPATETTQPHPIGAYPQFKLDSEQLLQSIIPAERLVILRLANIYGSPSNRGFIGYATKAAAQPGEQLMINGDGHQKRDYVFIDDLARAIVAVLKSHVSGVINIATGESHTLLEIVSQLEKAAGRTVNVVTGAEPPAEAETILLSNQRLKREIGFDDFTPLADGLKQTLSRYNDAQK